jgi:uncharacterized repeat protein (TIGR03803 family)
LQEIIMSNRALDFRLPLRKSLRRTVLVLAIICSSAAVVSKSAQAQTFTLLHVFTGRDGAYPFGALTLSGTATLYGTTQLGGGAGNVFKLAHRGSGWVLTPLYVFTGGADGEGPESGLVMGPNGAFYSTTYGGGLSPFGFGTVFKLTPSATVCKSVLCYWNESVLYAFMGTPDAGLPEYANLVFDQAGNIYGTTPQSGVDNAGTVFELTPSGGGWTERVIYNFTDGSDGGYPYGGVIRDAAGNLYGTALGGGRGGCYGVYTCGTVYELTPAGGTWTQSVLFAFSGSTTGGQPQSTLVMDRSGNLYGTTTFYGPDGGGTVFELTPSNGVWVFSLIASFNCFIPVGVTMDSTGNLYGVCAHGGAFSDGWVFKLTNSRGTWAVTDLHDFSGTDGAVPYAPVSLDASGNVYGTTAEGGAIGSCYNNLGCGVVWKIAP